MIRNQRAFPIAGALFLITILQAGLQAQDEMVAVKPPKKRARLSKAELAIWNDPAFQRAFAESYIAETDIEPRVTMTEREKLQEVLDLISSDQLDEAAKIVTDYLNSSGKKSTRGGGLFGGAAAADEGEGGGVASAVFDFTLANIHFQREELEEAVKGYLVAVEKYPKFRRAWRNLGVIYVRQADYEKAAPALTRVIELGGADAITYGLLGFSYSSTEDHISAESAYRMAILLDPKTLDWKLGLARSFFMQERFAEAVALLEKFVEQNPDRADLWLSLANAYIGMNQPMKAAELYQLVNHLGEATVESLAMLGDIYINEELYSAAVDSYIEAMNMKDAKVSGRAIRAARVLTAQGAHEDTGRLIESIESVYGDALEKDDYKELLRMKSRLAVASGEADEEVRILEKIIELDPLDGEALILLGQHSARRASEIRGEADNLEGADGDEAKQKAEALRKKANEQIAKAAFYYERAAGLEQFEADAKVRHAQLLVGQGKYQEALPLLKSAQQLKPRENVQKYLDQIERVAKNR